MREKTHEGAVVVVPADLWQEAVDLLKVPIGDASTYAILRPQYRNRVMRFLEDQKAIRPLNGDAEVVEKRTEDYPVETPKRKVRKKQASTEED